MVHLTGYKSEVLSTEGGSPSTEGKIASTEEGPQSMEERVLSTEEGPIHGRRSQIPRRRDSYRFTSSFHFLSRLTSIQAPLQTVLHVYQSHLAPPETLAIFPARFPVLWQDLQSPNVRV